MVARAPILGITGLIFLVFGLLSHWLTYNPAEGFFSFGWYSLLHVLVGIACLIAYFVRGTGSVFEFVRARSTRHGANAIVYTLLFVGLIAMLNFLAGRYHLPEPRLALSFSGHRGSQAPAAGCFKV